MVEDFLVRNEESITKLRHNINAWWENNLMVIWNYIKANIVGIFKALASLLPENIRPFVMPFFDSLANYK